MDSYRSPSRRKIAIELRTESFGHSTDVPFDLRPVPQYVGLFFDGDAARDAMLDEQRLADQFQHRAALPGRPAVAGEIGGERLDNIEDDVDLAFVAAE